MSAFLNNDETTTFEEALSKTGFGTYSLCVSLLSGVVIVSFACIFYSSTIVVPISACDLNTTSTQQGMLVAAPIKIGWLSYFIPGAILGAVVWGYMADQWGRKRTLIASLLAGATINALASFSKDWVMLLTLQFIASLMISGQFSLSMTILSESIPKARRNLIVLLVTSIFLLSQGLMAALAMPIAPLDFTYHVPYLDIRWNSWRTLLVMYSLPSVLTAIWLCFMQESPKFMYSKGNDTEALKILGTIYRINNRNSAQEYPVKTLLRISPLSIEHQPTNGNHFTPLFKPPLLKYTIIVTLLFVLEQLAAFKVWLPKIAHHFVKFLQTENFSNLTLCGVIKSNLEQDGVELKVGTATCGLDFEALLIVLVVTAMLSVANLVMILFVGRFGRRTMVIAITLTSGCSGVLVNLVPNAVASAVLFVLQLMGLVVIGLYTALAVTLFPTYLRALAISLTTTGARAANFLSIQVINYLLLENCELAFYVYGALLAFSAVIAAFLPQDSPRKNVQYERVLEDSADD